VGPDAGDAAEAGPCSPDASPAAGGCITGGVFVSTTGTDAPGAGTAGAPFATVSYALANLGTSTSVYVCGGTYTDQITIHTAVSLYGGMACSGGVWSYQPSSMVRIAGTSSSFVLKIDAQQATVDVEDLEFDGTAASLPGSSSVAVWVNATPNATLHRVSATGGPGAAGSPGFDVVSNYGTPTAATAGNANGGGSGGIVHCFDGSMSVGGAGGGPALASGGLPQYVSPIPIGINGAGGQSQGACQGGGGSGTPGSDGQGGTGGPGVAPETGLPPLGVFVLATSSWQPGAGSPGLAGSPGQGGGGGDLGSGGAGGGGGAGGCGGAGGRGGGGGGASFALLAINSPILLDHCILQGGLGGAGGQGGDGQPGQPGAAPGPGGAPGCAGGAGGYGGGGGGGGGGAAGFSVGLAYVGMIPTLENGTLTGGALTPATFGTGGGGGSSDPGGSSTAAAQGGHGGAGMASSDVMLSLGQMLLPSQ
jgi:hypothetical protein